MLVNKCDVCGHEIENFGARYRVKGLKVEEEHGYGRTLFWKKKDLCSDCRRNIVRVAKLLKAGMEVNEVFVREQSEHIVTMDGLPFSATRYISVPKERFNAIERNADTVVVSCTDDNRIITFNRAKESTNE